MRITTLLLTLAAAMLAHSSPPLVAADAAGLRTMAATKGVASRLQAGVGAASPQCVAEAAAYSEVADLAYSYHEGEDIFADALSDLRGQLLDCLATAEEGPEDGSLLRSARDWRI